MAYNTFRKQDMDAERELAKYLDKYLYSKEIFTRKERTDNAQDQMNGSDIIISIPSKGIQDAVVDEKASIYYINKGLPTFVLELSFVNRGMNIQDGWFVNPNLATEYYLMQWIRADVENPWYVKEDNITEIECVLVSKKKLLAYFEGYGYDIEQLKAVSKQIRTTGLCPAAPTPEFKFFYTKSVVEKPINIVLKKEVYIRLGEFHYFIKP